MIACRVCTTDYRGGRIKMCNVSKSDERSSKNRPTKECKMDELATCAGKQNNGRTNVCMVGPNSVCKI